MKKVIFSFIFVLSGCASNWYAPDNFLYKPIVAGDFEIATWQKITDNLSPVHIYIEGDGHSFDGRGIPTSDPTPHGMFLRNLAIKDSAPNVVYMARPCQFIMSDSCSVVDWTVGRFSKRIIDAVSNAVKQVAGNRDVILIGYSGGAMVSGLVIKNNPDLNIKKWITIAGVLNHSAWTDYFGDAPLVSSLSLGSLPDVDQLHYVAEFDKVVPFSLTQNVVSEDDIIIVSGATHNNFGNITINF